MANVIRVFGREQMVKWDRAGHCLKHSLPKLSFLPEMSGLSSAETHWSSENIEMANWLRLLTAREIKSWKDMDQVLANGISMDGLLRASMDIMGQRACFCADIILLQDGRWNFEEAKLWKEIWQCAPVKSSLFKVFSPRASFFHIFFGKISTRSPHHYSLSNITNNLQWG